MNHESDFTQMETLMDVETNKNNFIFKYVTI